MQKRAFISFIAAAALPLAALAAGDHEHRPALADAAVARSGAPGKPADVKRTIEVTMGDNMRFEPSTIDVKAGETVRFKVTNIGRVQHEMVIGSLRELTRHAKQMREYPDMKHHEPNQLSLMPGKSGELVWKFTQPGRVDFACTVPGHLEAGMVGHILVSR